MTTKSMTPEQAQERLATESAIAAMRHYAEHRSLATDAKNQQDSAAIPIKRWLDAHPGDSLKDGETGWCAEYSIREGSGDFDYAHMPDDAILLLARAGAFKAESATAIGQIGKKDPELGALIKKYKMPGGEVKSLEVKNRI